MDIKLKHRLVGACVILALAVFFLPMILDSEKYTHEIKSQIPEGSVLKDSSNESQAKQQGSLTINLDEEEPEKAIITQEKSESTASESPGSKLKNSESISSESTDSNKSEQQLSESENSSGPENTEDSQNIATDKSESKIDTVATQKDSSETQAGFEQESEQQGQVAVAESQTKIPIKKEPQEEDKASPTVQPDNKPQFEQNAWVIQIGSFSNKENATTLVSELRTKGYRAYLRQSGEYSRVFVGPYPDEDAAESRAGGLAKIVGTAVKVIEFDPQSH